MNFRFHILLILTLCASPAMVWADQPCNSCHGWPPATGVHQSHASQYTCDTSGALYPDQDSCISECGIGACLDNGGYAVACTVCHKGGMEEWHTTLEDGALQIGFNLTDPRFNGLNFSGVLTEYDGAAAPATPYSGTNDTEIVNQNNDMSCSNIYCHSNGLATRESCLSSSSSDTAAVPPQWDNPAWDPQGDSNTCNNCHDDSFGSNAQDSHWGHMVKPAEFGLPNLRCAHCHYNSTDIDGNGQDIIVDRSLHVNGLYEQQPSGTGLPYNGGTSTFTFEEITPGVFGCSNISCHGGQGRYWNLKRDNCEDPTPYVGANQDPVIFGWDAYATDANTLVLIDKSYDPDYLDPAKNAAYGGGHDGSYGMFQFDFGGECLRWEGRYMTDQPTDFVLAHRYSDEYIANRPGEEGTVAVSWYAADNNPYSITNAGQGTSGGWAYSGWQLFTMADIMIDDPMANKLPIITHTTSNTPGSWIVDLTITALDPDANDAAKHTHYGNKGHNGSDGLIQVFWGDDAIEYYTLPMSEVESQTTVSFDFSSTTKVINQGHVWFTYYVADNHYLQVSPTYDQLISNGWAKHEYQ